jgi:hypothetical protein
MGKKRKTFNETVKEFHASGKEIDVMAKEELSKDQLKQIIDLLKKTNEKNPNSEDDKLLKWLAVAEKWGPLIAQGIQGFVSRLQQNQIQMIQLPQQPVQPF